MFLKMRKYIILILLIISLYGLNTIEFCHAQDYDESIEITIDSFNAVKDGVEKTTEEIEKLENRLQYVKKAIKNSNINQNDKLNLLQKIAESEYALSESKSPLKKFNKYADKTNNAIDVYTEITTLKAKYDEDKQLQGSLAANLRILNTALNKFSDKIPVIGDLVESYTQVTDGLLNATKEASITIDKNRNQLAISGQGYYKAGYSKEKYEILLEKYPDLAQNYTYLPKGPNFVYEAVEPNQPTLIWDQENKDFYVIPPDIPVDSIYKMRLNIGRKSSPYELKMLSEKWNNVGGVLYQNALVIGTVFQEIDNKEGYNEVKEIYWQIRNNNSDNLRDIFNDFDTFQSRYMFDTNFKRSVDNSFRDFYIKLCNNPKTKEAAEGLFKLIKQYNIKIDVPPPPSQKIVTTTDKPYQKQTNNNHSWANKTKTPPQITYKTPVKNTQQSYKTAIPPSQDPKVKEMTDQMKKDTNGKKICSSFMQSLILENQAMDARDKDVKRRVVFTRSFQYENGNCVGAYEVWLKEPNKNEYAAFIFYSPSDPAKLPAGGLKSSWKQKYPQLDWGE